MRGRPRKWTVSRHATTADLAMWKALQKRYGSRAVATRQRVVREFRSWINVNGLAPRSGVHFYIGSLLNSHLKIGTVKTYFGYIFVSHPQFANEPLWMSAYSTLAAAHADALVREARRICWADYRNIIAKVPIAVYRLTIMMIAVTGLRLADLQRLRRSQIAILDNEIRVRVKVSKGRRSAEKAKTLRLTNFNSIFRFNVPTELGQLSLGDPADRPFSDITVPELNKVLKVANLWPDERHPTTYSFRKLYMSTILAHFNWNIEEAMELSMHVSSDSLSGYYDTLL